jgi:hypothetical protein
MLDAIHRDSLGRRVREVWIAWAREQPNPKASWLKPWEALSEADREVDRRIGEVLFTMGAEEEREACASVAETRRDEYRRVAASHKNRRESLALSVAEGLAAESDCIARAIRGRSGP